MNSLFDGIPQLLADLRAAGVRLAVATSKAEPTARRILEHFGLDEHFEVIAGASLDGVRADQVRGDGACTRPARPGARTRGDGRRPRPRCGGRRRARHRHRRRRLGLRADRLRRPVRRTAAHVRRSTIFARCSVSNVAAGAAPVSEPLHVTFICSGQHLPLADGGEDVRPSDQRARAGRRRAGHQRGNRRLACRRGRRQPRQPSAARHGYPTEHRREADQRGPPVGRPRGGAGPKPRADPARHGRRRQTGCGCCGRSTRSRVRMRSMSRTPTTARTTTSRTSSPSSRPRCPGLHEWVDEQLAGPRNREPMKRVERSCLRPGWLALFVVVIAFAYLCFTVLAPWQLGKNTKTIPRERADLPIADGRARCR